jgi:hypothetical protein
LFWEYEYIVCLSIPWPLWRKKLGLNIFRLLVQNSPKGLPAGEIARRLKLPCGFSFA